MCLLPFWHLVILRSQINKSKKKAVKCHRYSTVSEVFLASFLNYATFLCLALTICSSFQYPFWLCTERAGLVMLLQFGMNEIQIWCHLQVTDHSVYAVLPVLLVVSYGCWKIKWVKNQTFCKWMLWWYFLPRKFLGHEEFFLPPLQIIGVWRGVFSNQ